MISLVEVNQANISLVVTSTYVGLVVRNCLEGVMTQPVWQEKTEMFTTHAR